MRMIFCKRCGEIKRLKSRTYARHTGLKVCDDCLKTRKYLNKEGGYTMTIKELNEYCEDKKKFVFVKNGKPYGFGHDNNSND